MDRPGVVADAEVQMDRRCLDYNRKPNGMVEGQFALTETAGEVFITALDVVLPPPAPDDGRTTTQRRHDALEDLSRGFLEGTETREAGGEKPHLNVLVDVDALEGIPGGIHETETGRVLDIENIRALSCDASVSRIVWNGASEIIDVGRRTRVVPAGLRRAVIVRDRHCVWRGCTRPPRWCDIHHLLSSADGGETVLANLCLLCRYHHTLIHRHQGELSEVLQLPALKPAIEPAVGHRPS